MRRAAWWLAALWGVVLTPPAIAADIRVINDDAHYPEGPIWYQGKLYYVEYDRNSITTWDGKQNRVFSMEKGCGHSAVVPTARGEFLVTCYDNGTIGRVAADGKGPAALHPRQAGQCLRRTE
jgi:gluconolactonase